LKTRTTASEIFNSANFQFCIFGPAFLAPFQNPSQLKKVAIPTLYLEPLCVRSPLTTLQSVQSASANHWLSCSFTWFTALIWMHLFCGFSSFSPVHVGLQLYFN